MFDEREDLTSEGVSKDIEGYNDILAKQIWYINQMLTVGNIRINTIENAISVLEANLSPYLEKDYTEEIMRLETETGLKLRLLRSDKRLNRQGAILNRFFLKKYAILLRFAKEKGFLPKNLKWEY